ncbi:MAG: glycoside hydrolase family 92 protein, partial [Bacteroidales bacterium]
LYNYSSQPWKAQYWLREVMDRLYSSKPDGYCGDEDNGQTSAWSGFSALGFYPVCPGSGQYAIGSPLFRKVSVALPGGKRLEIRADGNSPDALYIESLKVNAKPWSHNFLNYSDLAAGARIEFRMSTEPNLQRGTAAGDRPYSFSD